MGYNHFRFARRVDANTVRIYKSNLDPIVYLKEDSGLVTIAGTDTATDDMKLIANTSAARAFIKIDGGGGITMDTTNGSIAFQKNGTNNIIIANEGCINLLETSTPSAVANYGAIYTKNDNKLYFQDGAGTEHTVAFV